MLAHPLRNLALLSICACCGLLAEWAAPAVGAEPVALNVPEGFTATLYADDELAHDIFCLTLDSQGRVVVSGRGYVRRLIDSDGDGRADRFEQFADGPKTGAQGMYFHGNDLLCLGDGGLIRYRDADADGKADGPPQQFLKVKTGSEHGAHAIRKGPDGWWYLIVGNQSGVTSQFASLPRSPVKFPRAGAVLRLSPNLSGGQILAHGFRNAYDFDFNADGELFTFDSDGEREVSLPWYRPTRVFHVLPGSDAGWVSRSWKRPDYFLDMPPVVGSFGRGSPSGVVCYQHTQFPEQYRGALFVQDWTFGRVYAVPLNKSGATYSSEPHEFITGKGQFGFAPTDLEVGPDGSLFVSVGGRGTRGGVYRINYNTDSSAADQEASDDAAKEQAELTACLQAPQPLSSWSRAKWEPLAEKLGAEPFEKAINDTNRPEAERIRGIQILTEQFSGLSEESAKTLAEDKSAAVRAAEAWSLGRRANPDFDAKVIFGLVADPDAYVRRRTIEAVSDGAGSAHLHEILPPLSISLAHKDRFVRHSTARMIAELDDESFRALGQVVAKLGWAAIVTNTVGYLQRRDPANSSVSKYAVKAAGMILKGDHSPELKLRAARLMQLGLGGMDQRGSVPAAMTGYTSRIAIDDVERELDPARTVLAEVFPTGDAQLDHELGRLIAILSSYNPELLAKVLAQITPESNPTDDVHHLLVSGRIPVARNSQQRTALAQALVNIEPKLAARNMNQDNNWTDRIREMYLQLVEIDPQLPAALIEQPEFGHPGHMVYFNGMSEEELPQAVERLRKVIEADDDYAWTNEVVFTLANVKSDEVRSLLREQYEQLPIRNAVIMALAQDPQEADRAKFLAGLESSQFEVIKASLAALFKLPADETATEIVPLVRVLRRLRGEEQDFRLREQVIRLLRRDGGQNFSFVFGESGYEPQRDVVEKWSQWALEKFPESHEELTGGNEESAAELRERLAKVNWDAGDPSRGAALFKSRSCSQCHGGRRALGPDLAGVAERFSRDDLFIAIAQPSRDVPPRYQTTVVETTNGKIYTGLVVYHSVDGLTLRNGTNQTFRIEAEEIESRNTSQTSLMPTGLLNDLKPGDLADLYSYLKSLGRKKIGATAAKSP